MLHFALHLPPTAQGTALGPDETVGSASQAGYSGAEVIPVTEPAAGPIKSRAVIGW